MTHFDIVRLILADGLCQIVDQLQRHELCWQVGFLIVTQIMKMVLRFFEKCRVGSRGVSTHVIHVIREIHSRDPSSREDP